MEELTIRITLTNAKGWKETKSISLNRYEENKDLLADYLKDLIEDYDKFKNNTETTKKFTKEWRP